MKNLEDFLKPTQNELFNELCRIYKRRASICKGKYILVKGEAPIMLLAHLDTVHKKPVQEICTSADGNILMSPQGIGGDDRCGVYAITTVFEQVKVKPWLLFTCDEEVGCVGAAEFVKMHQKKKLPKELEDLKLLIEIDRRGANDAVYYDCDNLRLESYITDKGFFPDWGSYSDISEIAPELGVAAVNLSSGYYNAHTLHEYINRRQLNTVIEKVLEIVNEAAAPDFPKYEYVEAYHYKFYARGAHKSNSRDQYSGGLLKIKTTEGEEVIAEEDFDIDLIPPEIRDDYESLLDYYEVYELEKYREEMGDQAIPMLAENDLGFSYSYSGYVDDDDEMDDTCSCAGRWEI